MVGGRREIKTLGSEGFKVHGCEVKKDCLMMGDLIQSSIPWTYLGNMEAVAVTPILFGNKSNLLNKINAILRTSI